MSIEAVLRQAAAHKAAGELDAAERLLRGAVADAPDYHRARLDLTLLLIESGRGLPEELEGSLEILCRLFPDVPRLHGLLGNVRVGLMKFEAAARAFEVELLLSPADSQNRLALGRALGQSYERFEEADGAFDRAFETAIDKTEVLSEVVLFHLRQRRFARAVDFAARGDGLDLPAPTRVLVELMRGQALTALGEPETARAAFDEALEAADLLVDHGDTSAKLIGIALKARALHAAGRREEAGRLYQAMAEFFETEAHVYDPAVYLPDTPGRLAAFRERVGGRDIAVLLQGPSLRALEAARDRLAGLDVCFATVNKFEPVEARLLAPIGRRLDLLFTGNPVELSGRWPAYETFLSREPGGLLITADYAVSGLPRHLCPPVEFIRRFDSRLLYFHSTRPLPALPLDPLHVMPGNSLSVLLPLLVLDRPARIFLFGADGGAPEGGGEVYFAATGGIAEASARNVREAHRRLANEAWECDQSVELSMVAIAALHGLPVPEVFNCCPASNHRAFPRIGVADGLELLGANGR